MVSLPPAAQEGGQLSHVATGAPCLDSLAVKHRARLHRFVLRRIGHDEDAHDIAQQAFVAAALGVARFRGQSELSTWIYGIALNLVRNYLSRAPHRVHSFVGEESLQQLPGPAHDDPCEALMRRQELCRIACAMEGLSSEMQEVVTLVGVDGHSCEQAAEMLGVPAGTVRSRLCRARGLLRDLLSQADGARPVQRSSIR
jgi:RNA polymerase sigma factor (sigma-70 family)